MDIPGRMKIKCETVRYIDELDLTITLSKQDLAELIQFGSLRNFDAEFEKDKAIRIVVNLEVK